MKKDRSTVVEEVKLVGSLHGSQANGLWESTTSSFHQPSDHPDPTPRFLMQFCIETALMNAAVYMASTMKKKQHHHCCRNGLPKNRSLPLSSF